MNAQQLQSLARILAYLADEQTHFEEMHEDEKTNHIYLDVLVLEGYLEQNLQKGDPNP
ncbi:MAG: hypothetical protein Q8N51_12565 [Gammaproteobacteria bacterium]|nr:hypothetical protein [Gammaproteobacteria bacterium]